MSEFKCRASAAGHLMTNPKNKSDKLSKTTISYLEEWRKQAIYRLKKDLATKEISKGITKEDEAIDKCIEWLDLPFAIKNTERFFDDYFEGEPDLLLTDTVIDIKNSWDCWTFPLFDSEIPTPAYEYQVQVYMHLTGRKKSKVVYMLLNTPATFNQPEIIYDNVDKKYRFKVFDFAYDETIINTLKQRVIDCREYVTNNLTF